MSRLDAMSPRESNGKTYWTRLGVAWPAKQGIGYTVVLDAMPAPVEGQFKIVLMEPKPKKSAETSQTDWNQELNDETPF